MTNETIIFKAGTSFYTTDFATDKRFVLKIIERKGKWITVSICGKTKVVRANPISSPPSESILIDGFSPVYSYDQIPETK